MSGGWLAGTGVKSGAQAVFDAQCPRDSAVDTGYVVDPVHDSPLNQPHSPDPPHKPAWPAPPAGGSCAAGGRELRRAGAAPPAGGRDGWPPAGEVSEPDNRLNDRAARPVRLFALVPLPFPLITIRDDCRHPANRISGHAGPATRARESSWARTPAITGPTMMDGSRRAVTGVTLSSGVRVRARSPPR